MVASRVTGLKRCQRLSEPVPAHPEAHLVPGVNLLSRSPKALHALPCDAEAALCELGSHLAGWPPVGCTSRHRREPGRLEDGQGTSFLFAPHSSIFPGPFPWQLQFLVFSFSQPFPSQARAGPCLFPGGLLL